MNGLILLIAYILDLLVGDPKYRLHPVRLIGKTMAFLERLLYTESRNLLFMGLILLFSTISAVIFVNTVIYKIFSVINPILNILWSMFLVVSSIAVKDLIRHVKDVLDEIQDNNIEKAREKLSMIVGRDTQRLDEPAILRATIETLAENFVDGFLSPILWYFIGYLTAKIFALDELITSLNFMLFYKTTNTLDSMVGYKNARYEKFGKFSARLDDILNFLPARLAFLFLCMGAIACSFNLKEGMRIFRRDRLKHESPNSAHVESFVAGAIHISLGGPVSYGGTQTERHWIGDGPNVFGVEKVFEGILLILSSSIFVAVLFGTALLLPLFQP